MAIEKSLYSAPMGLDMPDDLEIEIEIVDELPNEEAEIEYLFGMADGDGDEEVVPHEANLMDYMEKDETDELASDLIEQVEADILSRKDWADAFVAGLEVLGLKYEERTEPWEGACGTFSTILTEAAIRFQADTMSEVFPAAGPVKTKIIGEESRETEQAAERVRTDMNYELTENMIEYRPEHERMLYSLGLAGSAFKKVYHDPQLDRQVALFVPAEDVIVPYGASHIWSAERVTHVMRKTENEVKKLQAIGFYDQEELAKPAPYHTDIEERKAEEGGYTINDDNRYTLFEIHADLVLDIDADIDPETGEADEFALPKPYVVTIEKASGTLLAIRRNWQEDDPKTEKNQYFVHYVYVPGFGFYGLGLIHIIGGYAKTGTSLIRQLVDAGTLSNLPGGLKSRDLRVKGDDSPIGPGEWRDVDVPAGSIRDSLMTLPYKEPSQTLLALLERITNEGRRLGAIADLNVSDMSAQAPVGTTLALLEQALKPMTAIQSRIHFAMKLEFKMLKAIIAETTEDSYDYQAVGKPGCCARKEDYNLVEVIPVSDPNSSTMAQRVIQYQTVMQMADSAPQIYNLPELHRQMIDTIGVKNADKIIPIPDDLTPLDPVSENMDSLNSKPMRAHQQQDHEAHLATHQAFIQDPMIAQTIGQNPQANQIMAAMQAHVAEHLGFRYRQQMEEKLGVPLPAPGEELPPEMEQQLSRVMADAGKQLTQQHQKEAAQKQAQQQAQDPSLQLQKQGEDTKRMEVERKAKKDQSEVQYRKDEQERKRLKDLIDSELKLEEVAEDRRSTDLDAEHKGIALDNQRKELDNRVSMDLLEKSISVDNDLGMEPPTPPASGEPQQ